MTAAILGIVGAIATGLVAWFVKRLNAPESKIKRAMELKRGADEMSNRQRINLLEKRYDDFAVELDRMDRNIDSVRRLHKDDSEVH